MPRWEYMKIREYSPSMMQVKGFRPHWKIWPNDDGRKWHTDFEALSALGNEGWQFCERNGETILLKRQKD